MEEADEAKDELKEEHKKAVEVLEKERDKAKAEFAVIEGKLAESRVGSVRKKRSVTRSTKSGASY